MEPKKPKTHTVTQTGWWRQQSSPTKTKKKLSEEVDTESVTDTQRIERELNVPPEEEQDSASATATLRFEQPIKEVQ